MSDVEETTGRREGAEIVRLKVDGAVSAVNTLRDQQTGRGVSLICPFPALEVDVPVSFGGAGKAEMRRGTIHRIGVEDDPETGVPRLRLSVRTKDARPTKVSPTPEALIAKSGRDSAEVAARAETALYPLVELSPVVVSVDGEPEIEAELDGEEVDRTTNDLQRPVVPEIDFNTPATGGDPAWAACTELPLPNEIIDRVRTRRRHRLASTLSWLIVMAAIGAGGYLMQRSGVVDVVELRELIAGFSFDTAVLESAGSASESSALIDDQALEPKVAAVATEVVAEESEQMPPEDVAPATASVEEIEQKPVPAPASAVSAGPGAPDGELTASDAVGVGLAVEDSSVSPAIIEVAAEVVEVAAASDPVPTEEDVTLLLPTRWPAEYAKAYRVREPNGVVVDIPGGLVKEQGWLEEFAETHPMVRSVKAVQRETGARFIVFVNGELPRFMTAPKTGGVSLRLYHVSSSEPMATEKVALLD